MKYFFPIDQGDLKKKKKKTFHLKISILFVNLMSVLSTEFERPAVKCNEGYNHHSEADKF